MVKGAAGRPGTTVVVTSTVHHLVEVKDTAGHEVISHHCTLCIKRQGDLQVPGLGCPLQSSHMPFQLPRIQAQPFRNHYRLWMPLLEVEGQLDQYITVLLQDFKPLESTNQPPELSWLKMRASADSWGAPDSSSGSTTLKSIRWALVSRA
jgi:hypothetical protein